MDRYPERFTFPHDRVVARLPRGGNDQVVNRTGRTNRTDNPGEDRVAVQWAKDLAGQPGRTHPRLKYAN